jgi:hypothetical protein
MSADPLCARLAALEQEMRSYLGPSWPPNMQTGERVKMWADELAALLREPPPAHEGTCNPFVAACGATFCDVEEMVAHNHECAAARAAAPEEP